MKNSAYFEVTIEKLVHGGQGLGALDDGRKAFVWNALPGERVKFLVTKKKRDWCEGIATEIIKVSPDRIEPCEPQIFTATSPWQIIDYPKEAKYKQAILVETFEREKVLLNWQDFYQADNEYGYRNKMEYNFWFDNETQKVSLALHKRGTHQKVPVLGSALASDVINTAGQALVNYINENNIEARPLKSVILRSDSNGITGVSLFVNDKSAASMFSKFNLPNSIVEILFSNPKSPASVATKVLKKPKTKLNDTILSREFSYSTRSFFQVNIPVYEAALKEIAVATQQLKSSEVLDLYSGVGSIGLSVVDSKQRLTLIETEKESAELAKLNIIGRRNCKVVTASVEASLDYFEGKEVIIVDPPRAGLHTKVVAKLKETKPEKIIYLSCNPSTQARDIKILIDGGYTISFARGYNFFPRTPHIESLIVLDRVK